MYYVIDVVWSQTDKDTYIVVAQDEESAILKVRMRCLDAKYINVIRKTRDFVN